MVGKMIISLTTQDSMSAWSGNNSVTSTVPADASKPVAAHKQQAADVRKDVSANPDPLWSPFDWKFPWSLYIPVMKDSKDGKKTKCVMPVIIDDVASTSADTASPSCAISHTVRAKPVLNTLRKPLTTSSSKGAHSQIKKEFKTAETVQTSWQAASPQQPANTAGPFLLTMPATTCEIQTASPSNSYAAHDWHQHGLLAVRTGNTRVAAPSGQVLSKLLARAKKSQKSKCKMQKSTVLYCLDWVHIS
ncbi:TPA: hypothetical protein ACH3X3_010365 [Trebouxia sp. C0006]